MNKLLKVFAAVVVFAPVANSLEFTTDVFEVKKSAIAVKVPEVRLGLALSQEYAPAADKAVPLAVMTCKDESNDFTLAGKIKSSPKPSSPDDKYTFDGLFKWNLNGGSGEKIDYGFELGDPKFYFLETRSGYRFYVPRDFMSKTTVSGFALTWNDSVMRWERIGAIVCTIRK